jgi:hypothetical protein
MNGGPPLTAAAGDQGDHLMPVDGSRTWLTSDANRRWRSALMATPWGRANTRRVILVKDGERIANATRYTSVAVLDRRSVRVWAIGDVSAPGATAADDVARHTLIEQVTAEARADGAEVALLLPPLDSKLCCERHFVDITPDTLTLRIAPGRRPGAPMVMIRAGEDRDLAAISAMGQLQAAPFRFHLDRDVDFVQHAMISRRLLAGLGARGAHEFHFFVVEEGSTAVAYTVLSVSAGEWWIEACGDRDPTGQRVGAILQALLARDPSAPAPRIRGWLPASLVPPQATVTARERSPVTVMACMLAASASARPLNAADALYWKSDVF